MAIILRPLRMRNGHYDDYYLLPRSVWQPLFLPYRIVSRKRKVLSLEEIISVIRKSERKKIFFSYSERTGSRQDTKFKQLFMKEGYFAEVGGR